MLIPNFSHKGSVITTELSYFKKPNNIGKILSAESTVELGKEKENVLLTLSIILLAPLVLTSAVSWVIIKWVLNGDNSFPSGIWIGVLVVSLVWSALSLALHSFEGKCSYVGEFGFSFFQFKKKIENITKAEEVNFNEITDLYSYYKDDGAESYYWMNKDKVVCHYFSRTDHDFMKAAKTVWTSFQNERMTSEIKKNGFTSFNIMTIKKGIEIKSCVRLWNDKIEFVNPNGSEYYSVDELNNLEIIDYVLYFRHDVYDKKHLFDREKKSKIPLMHLGNRLNFIWALKLLYNFDAMIILATELDNMLYFENVLGLDKSALIMDRHEQAF